MYIRVRTTRYFLVLLLFLSASALTAYAQDSVKYEVTGFRDARFGMTEPEVRAAAIKSLSVKDADIKSSINALEGTNLLTVRLQALDPGPGQAMVTYIFGNKSKRLIQVNVIWSNETSKLPVDTDAMIGAGTRLQHYFANFSWQKDAAKAGIPVGDNTVVLFAGEDDKKGAVRVILDGIKYQMAQEGKQTTSPEPKTPPKLIVNYVADRDNPDIAKIERGAF